MTRFVWTEPAVADLEAIVDFIASDSDVYARVKAERVLAAVDRVYDLPRLSLLQQPELLLEILRRSGDAPAESGGHRRTRSGGLTRAALVSLAALVLLLALDATAWASGQLPLVTDVPESPPAGALEFDLAYGLDRVRRANDDVLPPGRRTRVDMTIPTFLLDYGVTDRIEARIDGAAALTRLPNGSTAAGFDDICTGLKYRFLDQSDRSGEDQDRYAWEGPVSASVFPQFTFPTGPQREGIRDGEYAVLLPVDVSREIGALTLVGEGTFLSRYHHRAGPNEFELGIAAFYALTPHWALLGEQRVTLPTVGQGTAEWLFNMGAFYEVTEHFALFGSAGRTFRASSRIEERTLMFVVGFEVTHGSE